MNKRFRLGFSREKRAVEKYGRALHSLYQILGATEAEFVRERYIEQLQQLKQKMIKNSGNHRLSAYHPVNFTLKVQQSAPINSYYFLPDEAIEHFRKVRIALIRLRIEEGLAVPHRILSEYPRGMFAQDYQEANGAARHMAAFFGTFDEGLLETHGVSVCRQDRKPPTAVQRMAVRKGLEEIFLAIGDLSDLLRATGLKIVHTNGKRIYNRPPDTYGVYHYVYQTISLGVDQLGGRIGMLALAHELAGHWLDASETPPQRWLNRLTGIENPLPREILSTSFVDALVQGENSLYAFLLEGMTGYPAIGNRKLANFVTPSETWARAMEQFVADRLRRKGISEPDCALPLQRYFELPGYWSKERWNSGIRARIQDHLKARLWMARRIYGLSESRIRRPPRSYRSMFPWVEQMDLKFYGNYRVEQLLPRDLVG